MTNTDMPKTIHHGRNVKRFREMLDMKQDAMAKELGEDWTQRRVSLLKQREIIELEVMEQVAKALKVPVDAIKNYSEDATIFYIQHNHEGANTSTGAIISDGKNYNHCIFNPLEKYIEATEENKNYRRL